MKTILALIILISAVFLSSCGKEDSESFGVETQNSGCNLSSSLTANCSSKNQKEGARLKKISDDAGSGTLSCQAAVKYLTNYKNNSQMTAEVRKYAQDLLANLSSRCGS